MPKIKCSKQLANNPKTPAPRFNFTEYAVNRKYHNNPQEIDFVVYNGSLYVCTEDDVYAQKGNIEEQSGFLCVVRKGDDGRRGADGKDGRPGPIPEIGAKFEGNQLVIYEKNGTRLSSSPDLTGPAWIPVLNEDETAITWTDDQTAVPSDIPLNKILPKNEYPVLFRLNSDNTRRSDENETGPGYYIQWKREGAEEWTNLMSISELMNLALAGVSFWEEVDNSEVDATGQPKKYIHFGHKQVVKATYDASKLGNNRIAEVVLGDVLFDAGRVPFPEIPNYTNLFSLIQADIRNVKARIEVLRGLIPTKLSQLENDVPYIKSINGQRPNNDGNFILDDLIGGDGTVKSVNGVGPDSTGDVQLDIVNPDLSAYVKSVTINGTTKTPVNGNVSFNISVGETSLFDVKIENGILKKTIDGINWTTVGTVNGGTGDGLDVEQVKSLIEQTLAGLLDPLNEYDNGKTGHNYFVRINELNSILNSYATKEWVLDKLSGGDSETITHISYRTFTIYKWYSVDAVPSTPVLPTSASWDGTSNGLTLVGNTNSWSDHPGNRPNDSTRLWMATITLQSDGTSSNDWNGPIDLTAYPGKDGNGVEFIYTLCANETEFNALTTPAAQYQDDRDDDYPFGWTDRPQSIGRYTAADEIVTHHTFTGNEEVLFRIEAASIRTSTNGHWSTYCKPFIWSMWGEDGLDGDGIEYIFFLADDDDVTISNNDYSLKSNLWPDNSWAYEYQALNSGWKDDPTGVNSINKYEFVSKRKFHVDPETRQGSWSNWSEPALWSIYKEGPVGPIGPDGITITSQARYYKASDQSTGITAPASNLDPTIAANGGWSTSSNMLQLDAQHPYLWFFERTVYSNGTIYQSVPVIIRYLNSAVQVDYSEIEADVLEVIGDDLNALDDRLSVIVDTNGAIIPDGQNGLISVITNYVDNNQKSFADLIVDAKEADIKAWAGSEVADELGRPTLTSVKNELDGIDGKITTAATQARQDAVSDARTEWSAADATITSTVTNAKYVWVKNTNNTNPNDPEVVAYNGETTKSGYTKTLIADEMSALKQTSDAVSIIVGQDGQVSADLIISTINGGTAQIDANHIVLNGETIATAIQAAEISANQITSGTINANRIAANSIDASKIDATNLYAKTASFDYLTVNGQAIGTNNSLGIRFGNANTATTEANTIYFLYE